MILDIISITRTRRVKFTTNEYKAIKILSEEYMKNMEKEKNPDDGLKEVMAILKSIHKKVEHK